MGADGLDPLSRILKGDGGKREIEIGGGGTGEEEEQVGGNVSQSSMGGSTGRSFDQIFSFWASPGCPSHLD